MLKPMSFLKLCEKKIESLYSQWFKFVDGKAFDTQQ